MTTLTRTWLQGVCAIALTTLIVGCSTSPTPAGSGGAAPSPTTAQVTPGRSPVHGSSDPSLSTTPTPVSAADAFAQMPTLEGVLNAVVIQEQKVVVGGFVGPAFTPMIMVFSDLGWSVAEVPAATGQVAAITAFDGRLIAVGNGLPDERTGFVWDSPDGRRWDVVHTVDDAALYDVTTDGATIVAVGAVLDDEMDATAAAWSSSNGTTWKQAEVSSSAHNPMGPVAATAAGFVAAGDRPLGEARPFWTSPDAARWASVSNDLSDQVLPIDLVEWRGGVALIGATGRSGDQHPVVALSSDGRTWKATTGPSAAEGYASAATVVQDRLYVAGVDNDELIVWAFAEGNEWEATTIEPLGASISALVWDPDLGLVGVGARDGRVAAWLLDG